jgi:hypothetical protein
VVFLFAITLFTSAFLLFLVQPMVGKMILPALGGTPAVWNTCMVFFQAVLLGGYAYAHGSVSWLGPRRQAALQLVLMVVPLLVLPIVIDTSSVPPSDNPEWWLLWRLLLGVGLPFFVVSTNAPLLQRWFSETGHVAGKDPYFLYGASNWGSLLALLAYPVVFERLLSLNGQSELWSWGYRLLIGMACACAIVMWRSASAVRLERSAGFAARSSEPEQASEASGAPSVLRGARWIALAFVPSSLMLGVTSYITTDLAPVPLLWIIPLALYLLTFIVVFARKPLIPHAWVVRILPLAVALTAIMTLMGDVGWGLAALPIHLTTFFLVGLACHGELVRDRPAVAHLTRFYLSMSVGGVLGGLFNALLAPQLFESVAEYPLAMVLAGLIVQRTVLTPPAVVERAEPAAQSLRRRKTIQPALARDRSKPSLIKPGYLDLGLPILLGLSTASVLYVILGHGIWRSWMQVPVVVMLTLLCLLSRKRPVRFGLTLGAVLLGLFVCSSTFKQTVLYAGRNFYGAKEVEADARNQNHVLRHGTIVHGSQWTDPERRMQPVTYYSKTGPVGDVFRMCSQQPVPPVHVGIIGLGAGSMAAYAVPGQSFTFYEIDPQIVRIARDPRYFTFLAECRGSCELVTGDGRLTLASALDGRFGLIVVDAFSADAIPTHLLTREALKLYLRKLDAHGVLLLHLTNRYVDLPPVLARVAADAGLVSRCRNDMAVSKQELTEGKFGSQYVVVARRLEDIGALAADPNWREIPVIEDIGVWTDQYTNIFRLLKW